MHTSPESSLRAAISGRIYAAAGAVFLLVVAVGTGFFLRSQSVMDRLIKEQLKSLATVGAMQFSGEEIAKIQGRSSLQTPEFQDLVRRLKDIRIANPGILYTYIMRRTPEPLTLEFVADASSLDTIAEMDENKNGIIEDPEQPTFPGDTYDIRDVPALQITAFVEPTTDATLTSDSWGQSLSGYAPIRDANGRTVAVLGIDMSADHYIEVLHSAFSIQSFSAFVTGCAFLTLAGVLLFWKRRIESLEHLQEERSWLLQLILHQIGTPLTLFKWSVESLRDGDANVEESYQHIEEGIRRLNHVKDILLDAEQVQDGKLAISLRDSPMREVLSEAVESVQSDLQSRKQKIGLNIAEDLVVTIDRKLIGGVIHELLDNAIKFSPTGATIAVRVRRRRTMAELQVIDEGCGIPNIDISRMFHQFVRGSNAYRLDPNGTGMGLFIAKGIIEQSGGKISVESDGVHGTTVTVLLPLKKGK